MSSNTWQYLLYLLSTNCSGKHRQTDTAHCTAVLIKTGMFILITDVSLIAPQHQKVIQRQQLKLNLSLPFRRRQMLLISFLKSAELLTKYKAPGLMIWYLITRLGQHLSKVELEAQDLLFSRENFDLKRRVRTGGNKRGSEVDRLWVLGLTQLTN